MSRLHSNKSESFSPLDVQHSDKAVDLPGRPREGTLLPPSMPALSNPGDDSPSHPVFGQRVLFRPVEELDADTIAETQIRRVERKYRAALRRATLADSALPDPPQDFLNVHPDYRRVVQKVEAGRLRRLFARRKRREHSGLLPCLQCALEGLYCSVEWEDLAGAVRCLRCERNDEEYCVRMRVDVTKAVIAGDDARAAIAAAAAAAAATPKPKKGDDGRKVKKKASNTKKPRPPLYCRDSSFPEADLLALAAERIKAGAVSVFGQPMYRDDRKQLALPLWHGNDDPANLQDRAYLDRTWGEYFTEYRLRLSGLLRQRCAELSQDA